MVGVVRTRGASPAPGTRPAFLSWSVFRTAVLCGLTLVAVATSPVALGQQAAPADAASGPGLVPNGGLSAAAAGAGVAAAASGAHPLQPALDLAQQGLAKINANIRDYSCTVVKRERIDGKLGEHEYMFAKIRQQPFSVYLYFLGPDSVKGQEVIYVAGQNDGNMLAHAGSGVRHKALPASMSSCTMRATSNQPASCHSSNGPCFMPKPQRMAWSTSRAVSAIEARCTAA